MRRHVSTVENTQQSSNTRNRVTHHQIPSPNRGTQHSPQPQRLSSNKLACILASVAVIFLVGVHLFLAHVLVSNESRLMKEFSFPGDRPAVPDDIEGSQVVQREQPQQQKHRTLTPLRSPIDYELYTIRINSWKRLELLETSIEHHASCPGVAQIQVVWCDEQGEPPDTLSADPKVLIERHAVNSLNERFNMLGEDSPTMGILSIDDDVLRPCEAIDAGFFKWTQNPERMVGFDGRGHVVKKKEHTKLQEQGGHQQQEVVTEWAYAYLSETENSNQYSITLPRYAFLHRDYLRWYMSDLLPHEIFTRVETDFNCEDIAMSLFVSSLTDGQPPLLADKWASRGSQIKLYASKGGISNTKSHKKLRDACVNDFANLLKLKDRLQYGTFMGHGLFKCGAKGRMDANVFRSERQQVFETMTDKWTTMKEEDVYKQMLLFREHTAIHAYHKGLMEHTEPWKKRWNMSSH